MNESILVTGTISGNEIIIHIFKLLFSKYNVYTIQHDILFHAAHVGVFLSFRRIIAVLHTFMIIHTP